jgi:hypothetical protein
MQQISQQQSAPQLTSFYSLTEAIGGQEELAMDIEFENEWEIASIMIRA